MVTRSLPGSMILRMSHGYTVKSEGTDPLISLADEAIGVAFSKGCAYGSWAVDLIPPCACTLWNVDKVILTQDI